jgi:hypothetical protein
MTSIATRLLVSLLLVLAIAAAGFWAGYQRCQNTHKSNDAAIVPAQVAEIKTEVVRGKAAAKTYIQADNDLQARYDALEVQFNDLLKNSTLVAGTVTAADPVLTAGAVWMWDAALRGSTEPGQVLGRTCGADATPESACAALSPYTLLDAWRNHASNARACAKDRQRFNQLIDFLEGKQP